MTLPKNKVITVGKIIQNEAALFEQNRLMRKAIDNLENQLEAAEQQLEVYRGRYQETANELLNMKDKVIQDGDTLLKKERAKKKIGLYAYAEIGTPAQDYKHFFIGGKLALDKTILSLTVNPVNAKLVYAIGIGYRIF